MEHPQCNRIGIDKNAIIVKKLGIYVVDMIINEVEEIVKLLPKNLHDWTDNLTINNKASSYHIGKILDMFSKVFYDSNGVKRLTSFVQYGNVYIASLVDNSNSSPYTYIAFSIFDVIDSFNSDESKEISYVKLHDSWYDAKLTVFTSNGRSFKVVFSHKDDETADIVKDMCCVDFMCDEHVIRVFDISPIPVIDDININKWISGSAKVTINKSNFIIPFSVDNENEEENEVLYFEDILDKKIGYAAKRESIKNRFYDLSGFYYKIDSYGVHKVGSPIDNDFTIYTDPLDQYICDPESEKHKLSEGMWLITANLSQLVDITIKTETAILTSSFIRGSLTLRDFISSNEGSNTLDMAIAFGIPENKELDHFYGIASDGSVINEDDIVNKSINLYAALKDKESPIVIPSNPEDQGTQEDSNVNEGGDENNAQDPDTPPTGDENSSSSDDNANDDGDSSSTGTDENNTVNPDSQEPNTEDTSSSQNPEDTSGGDTTPIEPESQESESLGENSDPDTSTSSEGNDTSDNGVVDNPNQEDSDINP